jgi:hypothetical protein
LHLPLHLRTSLPLPAAGLLATLVPSLRSRPGAGPPIELLMPDLARRLRDSQRDPDARLVLSAAGEAALAVEYTSEENVLVHYACGIGAVTVAGGWLGAGRRRYIWLPLRRTLAWDASAGRNLNPEEIASMAADLHAGLDRIGERHAIEEFSDPVPIPESERREVFDSYAAFMKERGWEVSYDATLSRRSLKRIGEAESPQSWSNADREVLVRLEARLAEMLKGVRSSSRMLYQTK